jgi:hypothetical protein
MAHVDHNFHFNPQLGALATVFFTVFSFVFRINLAEADALAQFITHIIQGAAATIACIVGFYTFKNQINKSNEKINP